MSNIQDFKVWFTEHFPYNDKMEDLGEIYNLYLVLTDAGGDILSLEKLPNGCEMLRGECVCGMDLLLTEKSKSAFIKYLDSLYADGVENAFNFARAMEKDD